MKEKLMKERNLTSFMQKLIVRLQQEGRPGTAHVYQSTYNRIRSFTGGRPLKFSELTPSWLKAFQNYLLSYQLQWNTISTYMRMLRAVYFRAVDEGLTPEHSRLFHCVYTGTRVTVKRALDVQALQRLYRKRIPENTEMEKARKLFLLLFMLRGIPFVDIAYLRRCDLNGNILTYRRRKTGTWITVRVEPEAMKLIRALQSTDTGSPYLFPFIHKCGTDEYHQYQYALRTFNYQLKKLSESLGGNIPLSSYSARHSWATIANYRDYQQELISNAMGHSSVKVTETYFKAHSNERINEMNRGILSYTFHYQI